MKRETVWIMMLLTMVGLFEFGSAFAAERPAWVQRSDRLAVPVLEAQLMDQPEFLSFAGTPGADKRIVDWKPDRERRYQAQLQRARRALVIALRTERSAEVRRDIAALIASVENGLHISRALEKGQRPWIDAPLRVFQGMQSLLFDQIPLERRALAASRLRLYLGEAGSTSLFEDVKNRYEEANGQNLVHPSAAEVQQAIDRALLYVQGIRASCARHGLVECTALVPELEVQVTAHRAWLENHVLPQARHAPLPRNLYEAHLRRAGVDISPEELIGLARQGFHDVQQQMQTVAVEVAVARGWPERDYRAVFKRLKADRVLDEDVVTHYQTVMREIDATIQRERIVTLPAHAVTMRLGTLAESAAQPAPQFFPAPLFGNTDGAGQFVLPMANPGQGAQERYDDFSFRAAAWALAAHEGHPGHGLQFARFAEIQLPMARTVLTFNSVNAEGWALYAEAEMLPHQPPEARLATLQFRLLRAARAFLDPQIQLGQMTREEAELVLREDVGVSAPMARQELDRYEFKMVGQAPSYFYGFHRMMRIRKLAEDSLGMHFDRLVFNDFVIHQGMASPDVLEKAVREKYVQDASPANGKETGSSLMQ